MQIVKLEWRRQGRLANLQIKSRRRTDEALKKGNLLEILSCHAQALKLSAYGMHFG